GARVVTLSDSVATLPGAAQGEIDPHWWQDPRNAEAAVGEIRDQLVMADPAHAAAYRRNAGAYLARLARLDGAVARCIYRAPPAPSWAAPPAPAGSAAGAPEPGGRRGRRGGAPGRPAGGRRRATRRSAARRARRHRRPPARRGRAAAAAATAAAGTVAPRRTP